MTSPTHLQNIVLVGGSGNLGSLVLENLIAANKFHITVVTRSDSSSEFPNHPSIKICKGDYDSPKFLSSAFAGQDALVLTLHFSAVPKIEIHLIEAAAAAGVQWILPTEFGNDTANEELVNLAPMTAVKAAPRKRIEELGMKWIGVITNPWLDYVLPKGFFQIDVPNRKANFLSKGEAKFNTTTLPTVALAIARLLSLPLSSPTSLSLSACANKFIYISSFLTSQSSILSAVQRVTKSTNSDWTISENDAGAWIEEGKEKLGKGDFSGAANLIVGPLFKGGMGGNFVRDGGRELSNEVLGLPVEDLDSVVRGALVGAGML